jgi:hypothetical protein
MDNKLDELKLDRNTKLYKDGDCWCILVGDNIQAGELYYSDDKSIFGAVIKYIYEETNYYEPSTVEDLIPLIIVNLINLVYKKNNESRDN